MRRTIAETSAPKNAPSTGMGPLLAKLDIVVNVVFGHEEASFILVGSTWKGSWCSLQAPPAVHDGKLAMPLENL